MSNLRRILVISSFCLSTTVFAEGWSRQSQQYPQPQDNVYPSNYYQAGQSAGQPEPDKDRIINRQEMMQNRQGAMPNDQGMMNNGKHNGNNQKSSWDNWFGSNKEEGQTMADQAIKAQILQSIRTARLSPTARSIDITIDDGIVTLKGRVATPAESKMIESIAKGVPGVRSVTNEIKTDSNV
jgi:hypothetical protein